MQSKEEVESEKHQRRYNLRRRKDEADGRSAEAKPVQELHQSQENDAKLPAIPAVSPAPRLDFGGKIGKLCDAALSGHYVIINKAGPQVEGRYYSPVGGNRWMSCLSVHCGLKRSAAMCFLFQGPISGCSSFQRGFFSSSSRSTWQTRGWPTSLQLSLLLERGGMVRL